MMDENDVLDAIKEFGSYLDISPDDFRAIYAQAYAKARSRLLESIRACDIMSHPVVAMEPTLSVRDAVFFLDDHAITGAPVAEDKHIVGMLSETDIARLSGDTKRPSPMSILRHILEGEFDPKTLERPVASIMTKDVVTVSRDTSLKTMIGLIQEKNITRLPVTTSQGLLLGLVSRTDILNTLSKLR